MPARKQTLLILLLIVAIALGVRLYRLSSAPPGISGDELFNAIDAWRIGKEGWPVYFEGNNGREALFLYLMALSLRLLGQTVFALRLPAVLLGTGSVILAYLIGRTAFNRRVGLLAAALTAVSLWPIMESRWGLRAVSLTCFTALTIYLLQRALASSRWRNWTLGGVALGFTLYTYIPARAFPAVVIVWFGWLLWHGSQQTRRQWSHMLLSLLVALAVFAPFGWYMWQYPQKVNRRIEGLSPALDKALQEEGTLAPLGESIGGVLGMFTVQGDAKWRYHLSGEPVFDVVTGLFFYAGVGLCLWLAFARRGGEKRSSYALLLLWAGAMLVPNAILEANPSFLRAAGAIVPLYLITAVGFDALSTWVVQKWPVVGKRPWIPALATVGLALILLDSLHGYFTIWNNNAEVRDIYQAELAAIARRLRQSPPPPGTRVFVADQHAFDSAPQIFAYYSQRRVDWFNADTTFVAGSTAVGESRYFVPNGSALPQAIAQRLPLETAVTAGTYDNGEQAFLRYRLSPQQALWAPQQAAALSFANGPQLTGYDLPDTLFRGETVPLLLHWQIPDGLPPLPNRLTYVQAQLQDLAGNAWGEARSLLGYPQDSWTAGDRFVQHLTLEIPDGMPPGSAYLRVELSDFDGRSYPITSDNTTGKIGPFLVRSRPLTDFALAPGMLLFDGTLVLQEATLSTLLTPGLATDIALHWVAYKVPAVDYRVQLQLASPGADQPFYTQTFGLWPDVYPPSRWRAGEQISTFHRLRVPLDIPTEADPELRVQLLPAEGERYLPITQGDNTVADLALNLREHLFTPPPIAHPFTAEFGDNIRLLGYDLDTGRGTPGGELALTLYWQAIETPADHYTVFNHLVAADGQIVGQFDSPPMGDAWLTGTWLPGEVVVDERLIPINNEAGSGTYTLLVGLYDAGNGQRLPVTRNGRWQPGDQLELATVTVDE